MLRYLYCLILVLVTCKADIFKKCSETDFCNRLRYKNDGTRFYVADRSDCSFILGNTKDSKKLNLTIENYGNSFRITIDELNSSSRFRLKDVLIKDEGVKVFCPNFKSFVTPEGIIYTSTGNQGLTGISIDYRSAKITFFRKNANDPIVTINAGSRLSMETEEPKVAIALDVLFNKAQRAYGIPEHADTLSLRTTVNSSDPYRLYNVDHHYELNSTVSLYGSVPVLYAHSTNYTSGIFWHNAAETWVDIDIDKNNGGTTAYFISESGIIDLFVLGGPTPQDAVRAYASLTGTAPLPQYFTLGYHQSRWNYDNETDVQTVSAEFDNHDFPLDVIWLDIEYTDDKKYFTWDPRQFPSPLKMQENLTATNRKLVTIIDPHIKKENGYFVYDEAFEKGYFVKNPDGSVFEGQCWPGLSSYLDFLNPETQKFYAELYSFNKFVGSTENTYIWNDMNEPAVFDDSQEKTFPKDLIHYGNIKHRDVHNIYGFLQTIGTYKGLINRSKNKRPFILSRSHFAGSQRYTAVWTGDNTASWGHLAASLPMCLSEALAGISFCGADVGGFFDEPSHELIQRWYQVGAWLPFYREHSIRFSKRREPYVFPEDVQARIRTALRQRYAHLPLWYTLFWEHSQTGDPVIRPLFYNYPYDSKVYDIDTQLIIGNQIMVTPVLKSNVTEIDVYFPGGKDEIWYHDNKYKIYHGNGNVRVDVTLENIPVFYKGGSIIFRKDIPRPTTVDTHNDPYTLYIFPDSENFAEGTLYIDDMETFNYQRGEYAYLTFTFENRILKTRNKRDNLGFEIKATIGQIIFVNLPSIKHVKIGTQGEPHKEVPFTQTTNSIEINNLELDIMSSFEVEWK